MTARVGAELPEVAELRRVLGRRADDVAAEAEDVGAAIDRFRARSSEYVPHLPAHRARGAELAGRLDELGFRVERTRDSLAAADRWVTTRIARTAVELESFRQAAAGVPATLRATVPGSWAWAQRWALDLEGGRFTNDQVRFGVPGARSLPRDEVVALRQHINRSNRLLRQQFGEAWTSAKDWSEQRTPVAVWNDTVADLRRLAGRGPGAGLRAEDATSVFGRLRGRVSSSRVGAVGRLGSTAVGVAGIGLGAWDVYEGAREGDTEQVVTGSLSALSGVAMMTPFPPVQAAGALVAGGLLVYEYRDEVAAAGRAVVDGARRHVQQQVRLVRGAAELAGDAAGAALDVAGGTAAAVEDMAGAAWDAVEGLF